VGLSDEQMRGENAVTGGSRGPPRAELKLVPPWFNLIVCSSSSSSSSSTPLREMMFRDNEGAAAAGRQTGISLCSSGAARASHAPVENNGNPLSV